MAFQKGQSGNPAGRPKVDGKIREIAQQYGGEAIARLAELMHDNDKRVAVAACNAMLDRGFGKPMQPSEISHLDGAEQFRSMTRDEIMAAIKARLAQNQDVARALGIPVEPLKLKALSLVKDEQR